MEVFDTPIIFLLKTFLLILSYSKRARLYREMKLIFEVESSSNK